MKIALSIALASLLASVFCSCRQQRFVYASSKINTPMIKAKGDARLNAGYSYGGSKGPADSSGNSGFDLQAAYGVAKRFALMASYYTRRESDQMDTWRDGFSRRPFQSSYVRYRRKFFEIGGGYFSPQSKEDVISVYAGMALGSLRITDEGRIDSTGYRRSLTATPIRYFLQPGFSHVSENGMRLDLSLRLSFLDYANVRTNYTVEEQSSLRLDDMASSPLRIYLEPSFTLSFPTPVRWLYIESGVSGVIRSTYHDVRKLNAFIGLTTDLRKALERK